MIVFRADANSTIGSGHVMRCLSIADAAKEQGIQCRFIAADNSFAQTIKNRGYELDVLNTDYKNMETEYGVLMPLLRRFKPKIIIVDSYFVTAEYLTRVGQFADVAYIDDVATFAYPVKTLINYNIYGPEFDYEGIYRVAEIPMPHFLRGPHFAPLRKQFRQIPPREQPEYVRHILIMTGGADPLHIALQLVRQLEKHPLAQDRQFHLVAGALHPDISELKQLSGLHPWLTIHQNVQDMANLMRQCDLAVSAAGSTLYELCACGVPTVAYAFAENQTPGLTGFKKHDIVEQAGDIRCLEMLPEAILGHIERIADDQKKRQMFSRKMQAMVDGNGAVNIVKNLVS